MKFLKKLFDTPKDNFDKVSKKIDEASKARAKEVVFENELVVCYYDNSVEFKRNGNLITKVRLYDPEKKSSFEIGELGEFVNWHNEEFNWLYEAKFCQGNRKKSNGQIADFKLEFTKNGDLKSFESGIWNEGAFKKGQFLRSEFNGGTFEGGDFSYGSEWNVSPHFFISGIISEKIEEGDIQKFLGVEIIREEKDWETFNILSLPEDLTFKLKIDFKDGFYLISHFEKSKKENYGTTYTLENFKYSVKKVKTKNGVNFLSEEWGISCAWENIRCNSVDEHIKNTVLSINEKFELPFLHIFENESIIGIHTTKEHFSLIPDFSDDITLFNSNFSIELDSKEDFDKYFKFKRQFILSDVILDAILDISNLNKLGLIKGFGNFKGLSYLLNEGALLEEYYIDERINRHIKEMIDFKQIIINNLANRTEQENLINLTKSVFTDPYVFIFLKNYAIDFSKDPRLGFTKEIVFGAYSEESAALILDFKEKIETGNFYNSLNKVKKQILNSELNGSNGFIGFKDVLPNTNDENLDEDVKKEMKTISDFLSYIAPRITDSIDREAVTTSITFILKDL